MPGPTLISQAQNPEDILLWRALHHVRLDVRSTTLEEACGPLAGREVHWLKIDVEGVEELADGCEIADSSPFVALDAAAAAAAAARRPRRGKRVR